MEKCWKTVGLKEDGWLITVDRNLAKSEVTLEAGRRILPVFNCHRQIESEFLIIHMAALAALHCRHLFTAPLSTQVSRSYTLFQIPGTTSRAALPDAD